MADIIGWVTGETDETESIAALQELVNTGSAWRLEGSVGRTAMAAIESGHVVLGTEGVLDYWGNYVPSRTEVKPGTMGSVEYAHRLTHGNEQHRESGRFAACPFVTA